MYCILLPNDLPVDKLNTYGIVHIYVEQNLRSVNFIGVETTWVSEIRVFPVAEKCEGVYSTISDILSVQSSYTRLQLQSHTYLKNDLTLILMKT